jgi:hypothetical protein
MEHKNCPDELKNPSQWVKCTKNTKEKRQMRLILKKTELPLPSTMLSLDGSGMVML